MKEVLQDFLSQDPNHRDGNHVEGTHVSIARLVAWVMTGVRCLVEEKKRGEQRQKEYAEAHGSTVETVARQLVLYATGFLRH